MKILIYLYLLAILVYSIDAGREKTRRRRRRDDDSDSETDSSDLQMAFPAVTWQSSKRPPISKSPDTTSSHTYEIDELDISGYAFQTFDYWSIKGLLQELSELLDKIEAKEVPYQKEIGAIYMFNHLLNVIVFIDDDTVKKDDKIGNWDNKHKIWFIKVEAQIRRLFPDYMYKPESLIKVETVVRTILTDLLEVKDDKQVEEITKFLLERYFPLLNRKLTIELARVYKSSTQNTKQKHSNLYDDDIVLAAVYSAITKTINLVLTYGFDLDFIVQFLLAKIDKAGILTKQNYVKKFYFENFENARRADEWIQNVRQIRRKKGKGAKDALQDQLYKLITDNLLGTNIPLSVIDSIQELAKELSESDTFSDEQSKAQFLAVRKYLIQSLLNMVFRCHKEYLDSSNITEVTIANKLAKIWIYFLDTFTKLPDKELVLKNPKIAIACLSADNTILEKTDLAELVISKRRTKRVDKFFLDIADNILGVAKKTVIDANELNKEKDEAIKQAEKFLNIKARTLLVFGLQNPTDKESANYFLDWLEMFRKYKMASWCLLVQDDVRNIDSQIQRKDFITIEDLVKERLRPYYRNMISSFETGANLLQIIEELQNSIDSYMKRRDKDDKNTNSAIKRIGAIYRRYTGFCSSNLKETDFRTERDDIEEEMRLLKERIRKDNAQKLEHRYRSDRPEGRHQRYRDEPDRPRYREERRRPRTRDQSDRYDRRIRDERDRYDSRPRIRDERDRYDSRPRIRDERDRYDSRPRIRDESKRYDRQRREEGQRTRIPYGDRKEDRLPSDIEELRSLFQQT